MVCVGIDVAKDKHDCFILPSEGKVLADVFTIPNSMEGFRLLLEKIHSCASSQDIINVGLEATGHYSYNLLEFLLDSGLSTYVLNPRTPTCIGKASTCGKPRPIGLMRVPLRLSSCPIWASSLTRVQHITTRS